MSNYRPKGGNKPVRSKDSQENLTIAALDLKSLMAELLHTMPQTLKDDLRSGITAEKIMKKYSNMAAARMVHIAMTEKDSTKALSAIKEIIHQDIGKPTESKSVTHKFQNLKDEELDSLLLSGSDDIEIDSEEVDEN